MNHHKIVRSPPLTGHPPLPGIFPVSERESSDAHAKLFRQQPSAVAFRECRRPGRTLTWGSCNLSAKQPGTQRRNR
jgi:hypothetical protein